MGRLRRKNVIWGSAPRPPLVLRTRPRWGSTLNPVQEGDWGGSPQRWSGAEPPATFLQRSRHGVWLGAPTAVPPPSLSAPLVRVLINPLSDQYDGQTAIIRSIYTILMYGNIFHNYVPSLHKLFFHSDRHRIFTQGRGLTLRAFNALLSLVYVALSLGA